MFTRRYAGPDATDATNNAKLLHELAGLPASERGARYVCALALALPGEAGPRGGQRLIVKRGTCRGRIATGLRGDGGFGYDPLFEPPQEVPGGRTLGQWISRGEARHLPPRARGCSHGPRPAGTRVLGLASRLGSPPGGQVRTGHSHCAVPALDERLVRRPSHAKPTQRRSGA